MPIKRRKPKQRARPPVPPEAWSLMIDAVPHEQLTARHLLLERALPTFWAIHGAEILTHWIARHPGTRPSTWWRHMTCEPRVRVGGRGTADDDATHVSGLPIQWLDADDVAYLREHGAAAERFDPRRPPLYESQAAYLKRHKLLRPGEARRVTAADMKPEPLPREYWPRFIRRKERA